MNRRLTCGSLFAGIEGFGLGFSRAGIQMMYAVEKDAYCRAVIRRHNPHLMILDDVSTCGPWNLPHTDIVSMGFPCQDLSVAGLRRGIQGERSGLFYEGLRICIALHPKLIVWENVPGLLTGKYEVCRCGAALPTVEPEEIETAAEDDDLYMFEEATAEARRIAEEATIELRRAGCPSCGRRLDDWSGNVIRRSWMGDVLRALDGARYYGAWTGLDARYFGLAQRRQRLFGVFARHDLGAGCAREILSFSDRMRGDLTARQEAHEDVAGTVGASAHGRGWNNGLDRCGAFVPTVAATLTKGAHAADKSGPGRRREDDVNVVVCDGLAKPLMASPNRQDPELETMIVSGPLAADHPKPRGDGTDTLIVADTLRRNSHDQPSTGPVNLVVANACTASAGHHGHSSPRGDGSDNLVVEPVAYDLQQVTSPTNGSNPRPGDPCSTLNAHSGGGGKAICFQERGRNGERNVEQQEDISYCLTAPKGGGRRQEGNILHEQRVRRLTPTEYERLQGFPDDYTLWGVSETGKRVAMSDAARYGMCGNAVAVPVTQWVGGRIVEVLAPMIASGIGPMPTADRRGA